MPGVVDLQSHIKGAETVDVEVIKYHVDQLWEEFKLPIWVTEFESTRVRPLRGVYLGTSGPGSILTMRSQVV